MSDDLDLAGLIADAVGEERDPYKHFAWHRANEPVAPDTDDMADRPMFTLFRYADVTRVLSEPALFPSDVYAPAIGMVLGPSILQMDGAEHQRKRGLIGGSFRRRAVEERISTLIEPTVHELIDGFAERGEADLVRDLAIRFPIQIIAELLGIPREDYPWFLRESIRLLGIVSDFERGMDASRSLGSYFADVLAARRTSPRDDLISMLAASEIDGTPLPDEEIFGFLRLLLPAGAETTYRLLGNLLFALLHDQAQLAAVRTDRGLLPRAIEEALRWESPVQYVSRGVARDIEIAGVAITAGAHLSLALGSANRDETVFEEPDRFDLHAARAPHLAFAEGPHRCLGEHLARAEVTVAMNAVLDRLPGLRLVGECHVQGDAFRSPDRLPVSFET